MCHCVVFRLTLLVAGLMLDGVCHLGVDGSEVDVLLAEENPSLREILKQDDLIQEVRSRNATLLELYVWWCGGVSLCRVYWVRLAWLLLSDERSVVGPPQFVAARHDFAVG